MPIMSNNELTINEKEANNGLVAQVNGVGDELWEPGTARIGLADGDSLVRKGIRSLLDDDGRYDVVFEAGCLPSLWDMMHAHPIQYLFVDLAIVVSYDFFELKKMKTAFADCTMVMMAPLDKADAILRALRLGVDGYLPKGVSLENFRRTMYEVMAGQTPLLPRMAETLVAHVLKHGLPTDEGSKEQLSPRESEVLECMTQGMCNKEISQTLHVTVRTVKAHVSSILRKMQVADRTQAVIKALGGTDRLVG